MKFPISWGGVGGNFDQVKSAKIWNALLGAGGETILVNANLLKTEISYNRGASTFAQI